MDTKPQHVAVIGCGYVGRAIAQAFVARGDDVVATTTSDSNVERITNLGAKPVVLKLDETERLDEMLADRSTVYLCAGAAGTSQSYRRVYLKGVTSVLAAVQATDVDRIIYTSSTRVYAQDDGSWVDESSPTDPQDVDGGVLVETERALLCEVGSSKKSEVAVSVLRLGGIHGPGRELGGRISRAAGTQRADGDVFVNLIHVDDIVSVCVALASVRWHGAMNVTDGDPVRRRDLYDQEIARKRLSPIDWLSTENPPVLGKRVSNGLLRRTLKLSPRSTRVE